MAKSLATASVGALAMLEKPNVMDPRSGATDRMMPKDCPQQYRTIIATRYATVFPKWLLTLYPRPLYPRLIRADPLSAPNGFRNLTPASAACPGVEGNCVIRRYRRMSDHGGRHLDP